MTISQTPFPDRDDLEAAHAASAIHDIHNKADEREAAAATQGPPVYGRYEVRMGNGNANGRRRCKGVYTGPGKLRARTWTARVPALLPNATFCAGIDTGGHQKACNDRGPHLEERPHARLPTLTGPPWQQTL
ncbi:hypothetical protein MAPG_00393 [Magnaporthiopsis poae ATCC 64411]|uniref:Uncharacterized protein n=1 Tax=Magnaporthiopsis poae (strain ATCC 64411 / 73-15) TaxID=644358 RepID=A0A0C4DKW1_MAGP6|nr:hypothetical protein MAPG_00393 [Magnaporthiopsis poae ATCC 64411]